MLDQLPVLPQGEDHGLQRLLGGVRRQADLHRPLNGLRRDPLDHLHDVLEVIVESLAADAAGIHQFLDGDLVHGLVLQEFGQRLRDHLFDIYCHGIISPLSF